jgi:hypothetical protein
MTITAAIGSARALDGREAGMQAVHQALNRLGNNAPILGIVIVSHKYDPQNVLNGMASLIGNTPVIGFSSPIGLTSEGIKPHAVSAALIASTDTRADVMWVPGSSRGNGEAAKELADLLRRKPKQPSLLFADGFNAKIEDLLQVLPSGIHLCGALASGDLNTEKGFQIGGGHCGPDGLALARLEGDIRMGVGVGCGWQPVGMAFQVTNSSELRVEKLDERPAVEAYANLFGYPVEDWISPPLNTMVRAYPLGMAQEDESLLVRSPLRVEADGSFRMNAQVGEGTDANLLVGSVTACKQAAMTAARQALAGLEGARPVLALALADTAWATMFEGQSGGEIAALQTVLGPEVPLVGGYTLGQITPQEQASPRLLNQHMLVVVFGEGEAEK